jgi:hypothetical protein
MPGLDQKTDRSRPMKLVSLAFFSRFLFALAGLAFFLPGTMPAATNHVAFGGAAFP